MQPGSEPNPSPQRPLKGRGTPLRPPNRFEQVHGEDDFEQLDPTDDDAWGRASPRSICPTIPNRSFRPTTAPTSRFATASIPTAAVPTAAAIAMPGRATNIWG